LRQFIIISTSVLLISLSVGNIIYEKYVRYTSMHFLHDKNDGSRIFSHVKKNSSLANQIKAKYSYMDASTVTTENISFHT
jgi:hypothetical protein